LGKKGKWGKKGEMFPLLGKKGKWGKKGEMGEIAPHMGTSQNIWRYYLGDMEFPINSEKAFSGLAGVSHVTRDRVATFLPSDPGILGKMYPTRFWGEKI
jgi:hypothetical protein